MWQQWKSNKKTTPKWEWFCRLQPQTNALLLILMTDFSQIPPKLGGLTLVPYDDSMFTWEIVKQTCMFGIRMKSTYLMSDFMLEQALGSSWCTTMSVLRWREWRQFLDDEGTDASYEDMKILRKIMHWSIETHQTVPHCPEVYWCLDPSPEQDLKTSAKSACRVMGTTHTAEPHYDAGQTSLFLTWIFGVVSKFKPLKGGWYWFSLLVDHFVLKIITKFMTLKIFRVSISFIKIQCVI